MKSNRESPRLPFVAAVHSPVAVTVNFVWRLNLSLKWRFWRSACGMAGAADPVSTVAPPIGVAARRPTGSLNATPGIH